MVSNARLGLVDGNLSVVGTKTVAVGVRVREETALKHTVRRNVNTRDNVRWREGGLLSFGKVVFRVAVESHLANWVKRIVLYM